MNYFQLFPISILEVLLGIPVGFFLFLLIEEFKKPSLSFIVVEEPLSEKEIDKTIYKWKFLNIKVLNKKKRFRYFNSTIRDARAFLIFKDPCSKKEILKINARWYSGKEPLIYLGNKTVVDIGFALIPQRETIPPGEEGGIAIAVKFEGNSNFYAFNNESYLYQDEGPWSYSRYKIKKDHILLCVSVKSEGVDYQEEFLIKNPNKTRHDFQLSVLESKD